MANVHLFLWPIFPLNIMKLAKLILSDTYVHSQLLIIALRSCRTSKFPAPTCTVLIGQRLTGSAMDLRVKRSISWPHRIRKESCNGGEAREAGEALDSTGVSAQKQSEDPWSTPARRMLGQQFQGSTVGKTGTGSSLAFCNKGAHLIKICLGRFRIDLGDSCEPYGDRILYANGQIWMTKRRGFTTRRG